MSLPETFKIRRRLEDDVELEKLKTCIRIKVEALNGDEDTEGTLTDYIETMVTNGKTPTHVSSHINEFMTKDGASLKFTLWLVAYLAGDINSATEDVRSIPASSPPLPQRQRSMDGDKRRITDWEQRRISESDHRSSSVDDEKRSSTNTTARSNPNVAVRDINMNQKKRGNDNKNVNELFDSRHQTGIDTSKGLSTETRGRDLSELDNRRRRRSRSYDKDNRQRRDEPSSKMVSRDSGKLKCERDGHERSDPMRSGSVAAKYVTKGESKDNEWEDGRPMDLRQLLESKKTSQLRGNDARSLIPDARSSLGNKKTNSENWKLADSTKALANNGDIKKPTYNQRSFVEQSDADFEMNEGMDNAYYQEPISEGPVPERCRYWPNCQNGDTCVYYHPSVSCPKYPNCKFGDKCRYIHPTQKTAAAGAIAIPCRFGFACSGRVAGICNFSHPSTLCRFGNACTNGDACLFSHQQPCKFGGTCSRPGCSFGHATVPPIGHMGSGRGRGTMFIGGPASSSLTWVSPHILEVKAATDQHIVDSISSTLPVTPPRQ